jgi:predicted HTH transcriptional regulator
MPFPDTSMPGHKILKDRIEVALDLTMESANVDFKRSESWSSLEMTLVKSMLGMGNLADGGLVIVGVAESGATWELTGIQPDHLATFDVDVMADSFGMRISPSPDITIVTHTRDGRLYLAVAIAEFVEHPFVCAKDGPPGSGLQRGRIYHRPTSGRPRTESVINADDMRDMLRLAIDKGVKRYVERVRGSGFVEIVESAGDHFDEELGGL